MKVKCISRSQEEFTKERSRDLQKFHRNLDPDLHPFEKAREYTRALNAVKLDKVFAKPFVSALNGHCDGVYCISKSPVTLSYILSGSADGEIRLWDLPRKRTAWSVKAHQGFVRSVTVSQGGDIFVSVGDDKTIKQWRFEVDSDLPDGMKVNDETSTEPVEVYTTKWPLTGVDHSWDRPQFATAGSRVDVWDHTRSEPIHSFDWGAESITSVKFNPVETRILASTATDRAIALYDLRTSSPVRKVILTMKTNALCWNPMEAFNFVAANEDSNCYTFDMRNLSQCLCVHKDHVKAVMDVDFSPTGREFVTASYDKTVRLFSYNAGRSRDVYFTKRMQRVFCSKFSGDAKYVITGSDDMNIRLWKSNASEPMGVLLGHQKGKYYYETKLKERFQHLPEIRKIARHHHVPGAIHKESKLRHTMKEAEQKKEKRRRDHSAPDSITTQPERKRRIVKEIE